MDKGALKQESRKGAEDERFKHSLDYELITPGKSWMFVNPSHGCPIGCGYCVEQKDDWFQGKITQVYTGEQTISAMKRSPLIIKDRSPLTFFNYSDPMLPSNYDNLIGILETLDRDGWRNKVGLITKFHPGHKKIKRLGDLKNLNIAMFVSYSNFIKGLEPENLDRVGLMRTAHELGIKTIGYVRPVVEEWIPLRNVEELSHQTGEYVNAYVLSGIRLTREIESALIQRGLPVPHVKNRTNKHNDGKFMNAVMKIIRDITGKPVFQHTSCGMSYLFREPDYNSHDIREKSAHGSCPFMCVPQQEKRCHDRKCKTTDEEIQGLIDLLGKNISFERHGSVIELKGDCGKKDVSFIRHLVPEFVK
jgi:DNA repair photolyase